MCTSFRFVFQVAPIQINLDDLDALIADLSPEEVEELSRVDPDVSDAFSASDKDSMIQIFLPIQ